MFVTSAPHHGLGESYQHNMCGQKPAARDPGDAVHDVPPARLIMP